MTVGERVSHLTTGDFNLDGKADLAAINNQGDHLDILFGNGTGGFGLAKGYATDHAPNSVAVGDFNGDGRPDLAVASFFGGLMIFQAGSGGNLAVKGTYQTGSLPIACLVADFNGDHKLDVATIDQFGSMVDQFTGTGLGTFGKPTSYVVGDGPRWGAAADLNGDGLPEMAVANFNSGTITILASPTHATGFRVYVPPTATAGKAVGVTVTAVDAAGHRSRASPVASSSPAPTRRPPCHCRTRTRRRSAGRTGSWSPCGRPAPRPSSPTRNADRGRDDHRRRRGGNPPDRSGPDDRDGRVGVRPGGGGGRPVRQPGPELHRDGPLHQHRPEAGGHPAGRLRVRRDRRRNTHLQRSHPGDGRGPGGERDGPERPLALPKGDGRRQGVGGRSVGSL